MWGCFHVYLSGAANIWIERFATSSAIDLASADFWKPANVWGSDANSSNKKYSDRQILAVVGVIDSPEIASVSFLSDWWLTSASDPTLKRPFAVCLVPRVNHENFPDKTSYSYPLYGYLGLSSVLSFTLPKTNGGTVRTDGTNIVPSGGTNVYPSVGSAWIDVVLVFEDVLNPDGTLSGEPECLVAPGDDYVGSLTISVQTGSVAQSLTFFINGYYGSEYANSISTCQLVVTPYVTNTNAFDIRTSKNNNLFMKIADIDFSVNSVRSSVPPNDYYLFVSSSPRYNANASRFEFKRRGSTGTSNQYNSCEFEIVAQASHGTAPTAAFDGTMAFSAATSSGDKANWMKAAVSESMAGNASNTKFYNTNYQGSLSLRVTGAVENLLAGAYETNIYIHVVTDV